MFTAKREAPVQPVIEQIVACPECHQPAELISYGTVGSVEVVKIMCITRHWFLMNRDHPQLARD